VSAKGWHASTRVPRAGACVPATDRLNAPRGRRARPPHSAAVASSSAWRSDNVHVPADPSSWRQVDLVVGPREGAGAFATVSGRDWVPLRCAADGRDGAGGDRARGAHQQGYRDAEQSTPSGWFAIRCRTSSLHCSGIDASAALAFGGSHRSLTSTVSSHTL
jgi:hypothetical protein